MAERHAYAMRALEDNNLINIGRLFTGAVQECVKENMMAHLDPAVRLIAHHIAFSANGDSVKDQYDQLVAYCREMAKHAPNYDVITKEMINGTEVPEAS